MIKEVKKLNQIINGITLTGIILSPIIPLLLLNNRTQTLRVKRDSKDDELNKLRESVLKLENEKNLLTKGIEEIIEDLEKTKKQHNETIKNIYTDLDKAHYRINNLKKENKELKDKSEAQNWFLKQTEQNYYDIIGKADDEIDFLNDIVDDLINEVQRLQELIELNREESDKKVLRALNWGNKAVQEAKRLTKELKLSNQRTNRLLELADINKNNDLSQLTEEFKSKLLEERNNYEKYIKKLHEQIRELSNALYMCENPPKEIIGTTDTLKGLNGETWRFDLDTDPIEPVKKLNTTNTSIIITDNKLIEEGFKSEEIEDIRKMIETLNEEPDFKKSYPKHFWIQKCRNFFEAKKFLMHNSKDKFNGVDVTSAYMIRMQDLIKRTCELCWNSKESEK